MRNTKIKTVDISRAIIVIITLIVTIFAVVCLVAGIVANPSLPEDYSATKVIEMLADADKIYVKRRFNLFHKEYVVFADETPCAVVEGKTIKLLGDVFSLQTASGEVIMSEKEEVFHFTQQAQFYSAENEKTIRFERSWVPFAGSNIINNDEAIGNYKWSAPFCKKISEDGVDTFTISNSLILSNHYEITREEPSNFDEAEVVLMCCIEDAITSSSSNSSSKE